MSHLSLALLGPPAISLDGRRLSFRTGKAMALLIYLAVAGGAHAREQLAVFLWPESDTGHGRQMLRTTLAHLRQALEPASGEASPHVNLERDALGFNFNSDYALDLQTVDSALRAQAASSGTADLLPRLEAAAAQVRGDFLTGFALSGAPEFDDWASRQREAYHQRISALLKALSELQAHAGAMPAAIATAEQWVAHDRLDEAAHRRLMQLHLAHGDRAAARRAYAACRSLLADELHIKPAPETMALAERLQSEVLRPQPPAAPAQPQFAALPMVGRLAEFARLIAAGSAARRGESQVIVVEGEAGIGKTRLAGEFLSWAVSEGVDVWQGPAYETGGRLPYQPIVEALRARLERENAPDDWLSDLWLAELSRLLPELGERYPDLPTPLPLGESEAQTRLFEAVARLGQAAAARAPLTIFVDDVQWADEASLDLLHYALRRWATQHAPVLLLLTLRSEASQALAPWLADLARSLPVTRLPLSPLSAAQTHQLVENLPDAGESGQSDAREFSQWLFAETGGQPFFLMETLKALSERGWPADGRNGLESALRARSNLPEIPSGVRELLGTRLARLAGAARDLLIAGAVLGRSADFALLCQVSGVADTEGLRALDELLGRGMLREDGGRLVFSHDKLRDVVYAEASDTRRRVFHRRALEGMQDARPPAAPAVLAHHAAGAGLPAELFRHSLAAGEAAMGVFAVRDALAHFALARETWEAQLQSAGIASTEVQRMYRQLGRGHELRSDLQAARAVYEAMLEAGRALDAPSMQCAALLQLATLAAQWPVDLDRAQRCLQEAQLIAERSGDKVGRAETEWSLAQVSTYRLEPEATIRHARIALSLAREIEQPDLIARSLNALLFGELALGDTPQALAHGTEASERYAALGNRAMQMDSLMLVADVQIRSGHLSDGIRIARSSLQTSQAIENTWGQANSALHLARGLMEQGAYSEARAVAERGLAVAGSIAYVPSLLRVMLGVIHRALLNPEQARTTHLEAMEVVHDQGILPAYRAMVAAELCADCVMLGAWPEAFAYARQASAARSYYVLPTGHQQWPETLALVRAGDWDSARHDTDVYAQHIGGYRRHRVWHERAEAILCEGHGDFQAALAHLQAGLSLATEIGLPGDAWQIAAEIGRLLRGLGDEHAAAAIFKVALATGEGLAAGITDETARERFVNALGEAASARVST